MKVSLHGPLPESIRDHGVFTPQPSAEEELRDLQQQQVQLQNRILERQRAQQEREKAEEHERRTAKAQEARLVFDDLADELSQKWRRFRQLHLEACQLLQALAEGAGSLSELYNLIVQASGLPEPDLLAQVQRLGVCGNPVRDLLDDDWVTPTHVGYDWSVPLVPLKKARGRGAKS